MQPSRSVADATAGATPPLEALVKDLCALRTLGSSEVKGSIRWYVDWYERRILLRRILYRAAGVLVLAAVFASALVAARPPGDRLRWADLLVPGAVLFAALNGFFAWGTAWRGFFTAKIKLEAALEAWEAAVVEARHTPDEAASLAVVLNAFRRLRTHALREVVDETNGFFAASKFPRPFASKR